MAEYKNIFFEYTKKNNPDLLKLIREKRKLEPEVEKGITDTVTLFVKSIIDRRPKASSDKFDDYEDTAEAAASKK